MGRPRVVRTHKKCSKCGEEKPIITDFYTNNWKGRKTPTISSMCRGCHNEKHRKQYHAENVEERQKRKKWQRKGHLFRKYGLTVKEFSAMILEQKNKCKICKCEMEDPQVDHNHSTGELRGLLCRPCNLSLGLLKEDPKVLYNMISYINDYI